MGNDDTCKAWATDKYDKQYCNAHGRLSEGKPAWPRTRSPRMTVDVQSIRNYVRNHLEVDDEELPDNLLNVYLQDAFERTMALDNRWPRNETTWPLSKVIDSYTRCRCPPTADPSIVSVVARDKHQRLTYITHENAEDMFTRTRSMHDGRSRVLVDVGARAVAVAEPRLSDQTYDITVRGYRQPVWDERAGTIPDLDATPAPGAGVLRDGAGLRRPGGRDPRRRVHGALGPRRQVVHGGDHGSATPPSARAQRRPAVLGGAHLRHQSRRAS